MSGRRDRRVGRELEHYAIGIDGCAPQPIFTRVTTNGRDSVFVVVASGLRFVADQQDASSATRRVLSLGRLPTSVFRETSFNRSSALRFAPAEILHGSPARHSPQSAGGWTSGSNWWWK